ncbi:MAG: hypothetical protein QOF00_80, partial [Pseudonocardiales bacterium]|nr:hypothetical protein [Pseudonocardiales bacterium]
MQFGPNHPEHQRSNDHDHRVRPDRRTGIGLITAAASVRVVQQYERGLVYRFGRVRPQIREAGLVYLVPFADKLQKVNMQIITLPIPG